jgi:hypothetical protein
MALLEKEYAKKSISEEREEVIKSLGIRRK